MMLGAKSPSAYFAAALDASAYHTFADTCISRGVQCFRILCSWSLTLVVKSTGTVAEADATRSSSRYDIRFYKLVGGHVEEETEKNQPEAEYQECRE